MQRIVIIGNNSYLGIGLAKYFDNQELYCLEYNTWEKYQDILKNADAVINFAIAPEFSNSDICLDDVIDIRLANVLKNTTAQYIFMSSRKVYGISNTPIIHKETDPIVGCDFYSKNKIKTEQALYNILADNLTILRVSNIVGEPVFRENYKTFMGWICESMRTNGRLIVTQNEQAVKDFITKDFLHKNIAKIISNRLTGVYNLSAGFGIRIKDILVSYVGEQNTSFIGKDQPLLDQFILDNSKLSKQTGFELSPDELLKYLKKFQKELLLMCKCKSSFYKS